MQTSVVAFTLLKVAGALYFMLAYLSFKESAKGKLSSDTTPLSLRCVIPKRYLYERHQPKSLYLLLAFLLVHPELQQCPRTSLSFGCLVYGVCFGGV